METMNIKDLYGYINEIHGGYIRANYHPEDNNIVILNYTELTTFERRWNKYTMSARGLILDLTDVKVNGIIKILARPFDKFFNYGENPEYEKDIDIYNVHSVMEKMDGSLGISYIFKGEIRFATRGSFTSAQAVRATKIWRKKYSEANAKYFRVFNGTPTLLVEIIYPENRVVVDYEGEEKLVLLGIRNSDIDYSYKYVKDIGFYLRLPVAKQFENLTVAHLAEMKKEISANHEGWVVRFNDNKRLKIKGDEYMEVHRITYGLSLKAKFRAWSEGKLKELIFRMPEEFRNELEQFEVKLDTQADNLKYILDLLYLQAYEKHGDNRKDFAMHVNGVIAPEFRRFMFNAKPDTKVSIEQIRDYIYKNYDTYAEVMFNEERNEIE